MDSEELLTKVIAIELKRLRELEALIPDRMDKEPGGADKSIGELLGFVSEAAKAVRYAIAKKIILAGGEDPGWGS